MNTATWFYLFAFAAVAGCGSSTSNGGGDLSMAGKGGGAAVAGNVGGGASAGAGSANAGQGGDPGGSGGSGDSGAGDGTSGDGAGSGGTGGTDAPNSCGNTVCDNGETCRTCGDDCGPCNEAPFGNIDIHPEKLGLYMIPDIPGEFLNDWEKTKRSLHKVHALLPDAWIRWDNETGHGNDTPANVEAFVAAADEAQIPMIITASAVDGYDNWWANNNSQPTVSIVQIADGPYLAHTNMLLGKYANVRLVETINEPDTMWFVSDPDDTNSWNHYMTKLYAAMSNDYAHVLGPAVAFKNSQIWQNHAARSELTSFSYHTYDAWQGLAEVGAKAVYVTEYGITQADIDIAESPGPILADLWQIESNDKLDGKIEMIFHVMLQRMLLWGVSSEGDHFSLSSHLRALTLYAALGSIGTRAHLDPANPDFMATDDRHGAFASRSPTRAGSPPRSRPKP